MTTLILYSIILFSVFASLEALELLYKITSHKIKSIEIGI
jgi:hypothetical protein